MDSVSIELWLDKRQLAALEQALAEDGTTVDRIMQERLDELYAQRVPPEQQEKIQQELDAEQLESQRSVEANTRYAGFHITENGQEHYLSTKSGQEFLDMALLMRRYVRSTFGDKAKGFAQCIYGAEEISPQRFEQLAAWRLENLGKVTGLVEIDFDKGLLSALNIMDGWQTWAMRDVSVAVYHATRSQFASSDDKWRKLLDHLKGKEITSAGHLSAQNFSFGEEIIESDGKLNFYLQADFDVDAAFGTFVCTDQNDDWLNIYANYDMEQDRLCDTLELNLCKGDGSEESWSCPLNAAEQEVLLRKMEAFCQQQTGMSLHEYAQQLRDSESQTPGLQM